MLVAKVIKFCWLLKDDTLKFKPFKTIYIFITNDNSIVMIIKYFDLNFSRFRSQILDYNEMEKPHK